MCNGNDIRKHADCSKMAEDPNHLINNERPCSGYITTLDVPSGFSTTFAPNILRSECTLGALFTDAAVTTTRGSPSQ